jgi:hypothetical protein
MKKALTIIAAMIFGAAFYAGVQSLFTKAAPADQSADASAIKAARDVLAHERERAAALDKRELDLKIKAANLETAQNAPAANANNGGLFSSSTTMAAVMQTAKAFQQQKMETKMAGLKLRLKLTDDQVQAIQDLMDKQNQFERDLTDKMLAGKMSLADMEKAAKDAGPPPNWEAQMQGLLTPDQATAYQGYQDDEKKAALETQANSELSQIQSALQLSDDQKDKVFTILYQQEAQPAGGSNDDQQAATKAAMQAVLTPEQFDAYSAYMDSQKKRMDSQRQMMQTLMGTKDAGASGQPGN